MKSIIIYILLLIPLSLLSRKSDCHLTLRGQVMDSSTLQALPLTYIELIGKDIQKVSSDREGRFMLTGLCKGPVELHISHLQCEHIHLHFVLNNDTSITIYLQHAGHEMEGATASTRAAQQEQLGSIKMRELNLKKGSSISELMQNIGGITLLKTGGTIAKPMVNGLHGNRVILLNNGVRQEGQNWGQEHAPEIDAFLATEIELLKGATTMRYAADGIGGVIMIKPPSLFNLKAKQLSGEFNAVGNTNGRGGATSLILGNRLSERIPIFWRVQGTYKKNGNLRAPDYFLSNTGYEEFNYSAALGYQNNRLKAELFHSSFYSRIAIFKGSQIGNINDLLQAFQSDTPRVVSGFSYRIDRPYQQVQHRLSRLHVVYDLNARTRMELSAAYQNNHRQEYDILRSSASYQGPDLNYFLHTFLADGILQTTNLHRFNYAVGFNVNWQANSFAGRFFVPGYYNKGAALFVMADKTMGRVKLEAALRYDVKQLTAYLWTGNNLNTDHRQFNSGTYLVQALWQLNRKMKFTAASSSAWRAPAPNELYSNGLHQGLASIETGDATLLPERSFNQNLQWRYASKVLTMESEVFYKRIGGFINLVPTLPPQLTIRGAFPVFKYIQQDVQMTGLNLMARKEFAKHGFVKLNGQMMLGRDMQHRYLSQMPPFSATLWVGREDDNTMIQLWCRATARQYRYEEGSDYVAPPKGYALLGADMTLNFKIKQQPFKFNLSFSNIMNSRYREYLNRFRYFADEPGFGMTARLIVPLNIKQTNQTIKS